jgi:hypothetical protein
MQASESIADLAKALAAAQGDFKNAEKDCNNPFFKSKYADMASVKAATQEALTKHELSIVQLVGGGHETVTITTRLMHSSGQWIQDSLELKPTKADPQGIGSATTYGRRYALMGILGVATDDDDGNEASKPQPKPEPKQEAPVKPRAVPNEKSAETETWFDEINNLVSAGKASPAMIKDLNMGSVGEAYKKNDAHKLEAIYGALLNIVNDGVA